MKHAREDYNRIQDPDGKIPADEPVFLLRGQDIAAPGTLRDYANRAGAAGASPELIEKVRAHADLMERWQEDNGFKIPDLPHEQQHALQTDDDCRNSR